MNIKNVALVAAVCTSVALGLMLLKAQNVDHEVVIREKVIGVSGQCNDGLYTTARSRKGACSSHGGIAKWFEEGQQLWVN